jgi:hypothetical protein
MPIDVQKLIGEVAARNHCRIEDHDPIFAVSTINQLMLNEVFEGLLARIRDAIAAFETSARAVDAHAGTLLAEEVRKSASTWKAEIAKDIDTAHARSCEMIDRINAAHSNPAMVRWGTLGLFAAMLLFGCGTLFGIFIR